MMSKAIEVAVGRVIVERLQTRGVAGVIRANAEDPATVMFRAANSADRSWISIPRAMIADTRPLQGVPTAEGDYVRVVLRLRDPSDAAVLTQLIESALQTVDGIEAHSSCLFPHPPRPPHLPQSDLSIFNNTGVNLWLDWSGDAHARDHVPPRLGKSAHGGGNMYHARFDIRAYGDESGGIGEQIGSFSVDVHKYDAGELILTSVGGQRWLAFAALTGAIRTLVAVWPYLSGEAADRVEFVK